MSKSTETMRMVLARNSDGNYLIWRFTPIDEIELVNGNWIGMGIPKLNTTELVSEYLGVEFPSMLSIGFGHKIEIEVTKVIQTFVKHVDS